MIVFTIFLSLAVLLISNLWLLREVERLRHSLDVYQREVLALDARICRLTVQVELMAAPHDSDVLEESEQILDASRGRGDRRDGEG